MSKQYDDDDFEQILDEAALWVSRMQGTDLTVKQKQAFAKWIKTSEQHQRAFDEMLQTWELTGQAADIPTYRAEAEYLSKRRPAANSAGFKTFMVATAASLMLFVGLLSFKLFNQPTQSRPAAISTTTYSTSAGELREIQLPDGSVLTLNTRSRVDMAYDDNVRALTLLKGEAYFEVAHDSTRPFIVQIGGGSVKAVGTAFNIYRKSSETLVTITDGVVKIKGNEYDQELEVDAMHTVSVDRKSVVSVLNADLDSELAWQDKQLVFRDAPLRLVIQELNRYLAEPVSVRKSSLPQQTVSGTFDVSEPEKILKVLIDSYQLVEALIGNRRVLSTS